MKKSELLERAKSCYIQADIEDGRNGDTMKRRHLISEMCDCMKQYEEQGGKRLKLDFYKPLVNLRDYYYDVLIFTPCVEDIEEMQYWI